MTPMILKSGACLLVRNVVLENSLLLQTSVIEKNLVLNYHI